MSALYLRHEPLDVLEVDGEALLLLPPDRVVRLSPIATTIFHLTRTDVSLQDLAASLEERFGAPAEAQTADALRAILDDLVAAGVLGLSEDGS